MIEAEVVTVVTKTLLENGCLMPTLKERTLVDIAILIDFDS